MTSWVITEIVHPLLRRAGSNVATALTALGVSSGQIEIIVAGLVAAGAVATELAWSHLVRKRIRDTGKPK